MVPKWDAHRDRFHQLIRDSKELQKRAFDKLIESYQLPREPTYTKRNEKMRTMLKKMNKSLEDNIGNVEQVKA